MPLAPPRPWTRAGLAAASLIAAGASADVVAAQERDPAAPQVRCAFRAYRWQEDCRNLSNVELRGLDRLRYRPLDAEGDVWLTLGGEARLRMDILRDIDFGIAGQPGYVSTAGRLLVHANLRTTTGIRAFAQLGIVEENGRKPGPRAQDESEVDVTQAFVEAPISLGDAQANIRVGRQELDLSGNRLVTTRDGATLRRAFEGVQVAVSGQQMRVAVLAMRPMVLVDNAFADHGDKTEQFNAISVDLPPRGPLAGSTLNVFAFDRRRHSARYLRAAGDERRYTTGFHYATEVDGWSADAQASWQTGRVQGKPIKAYSIALSLDGSLGGPLNLLAGFDLVAASGDRKGTNTIETFDPVYPNNGGLSDATLFYQTNYVFGGGSLSKQWKGVTWTTGANLLARHSTGDGVYTNGRPIPVSFGDGRLTSLLLQVSARRAFGDRYEIYGSLVHADALEGISDAGGKDVFYSRLQLTSRF